MATYQYRCGSDGAWDVSAPIGTAPTTAACPTCGTGARRVFSPPFLALAPRALVAAAGWDAVPEQLRAELSDELNVVEIATVHGDTTDLVDVTVKANFRTLGKRFGPRTPVVAAASGGLVEAVADGVSGVLLSDRDPERWAEAIDRLLTDPHRLAALGASAAEHAARHTWAGTAEQLRRVYRRAVEEPLRE